MAMGPSGTGPDPSHVYTGAGTYTVALTVTGAGGSNTLTRTNYITVSNPTPTPTPAPVAGFTASPTSGMRPLTVNFNSGSSTGIITSYQWNWGDGTAYGTTANPSHVYTSAGTYTVTLTVTGPGGSNSQTRTNYITVSNPTPTPTPAAGRRVYRVADQRYASPDREFRQWLLHRHHHEATSGTVAMGQPTIREPTRHTFIQVRAPIP